MTPENVGDKVHLRVELQSFWRLPRSNAIVFSIRCYLIKMDELVTVPKWARRLHRVLRDLPPELVDYKGLTRYRQTTIDWLSKYDDGAPTSPGISLIRDTAWHTSMKDQATGRQRMTRVAVIGAGPSGLAAVARLPIRRRRRAPRFPKIVCFEKQADWGGLWNYTWRTGLDEYGEPVHGSMYRYLWSNGPKECLEFADYTFEEHFGKPIPPIRRAPCSGTTSRAASKKAGVRKWVRFNTPVRMVTYDEETKKFTVTVARPCQGPHVRPRNSTMWSSHRAISRRRTCPISTASTRSTAASCTAHDFRDALEFKGKDMLIVGRSYSAEDIGSQCWKYGAKSVTTSYRSKPMGFKWPESFEERPLLQKVEGKTAYFKDGTTKEVDAIILCTGYQHHFPFLPDDLRLKTREPPVAAGPLQGRRLAGQPELFYIGMQDQFYTFNMFDAQAWYVRDIILGRIKLPPKAEHEDGLQKWRAREEKLADAEQMIWFQGDYVKELIDATDYPSFDIEATNKTFMDWEHHKVETSWASATTPTAR